MKNDASTRRKTRKIRDLPPKKRKLLRKLGRTEQLAARQRASSNHGRD